MVNIGLYKTDQHLIQQLPRNSNNRDKYKQLSLSPQKISNYSTLSEYTVDMEMARKKDPKKKNRKKWEPHVRTASPLQTTLADAPEVNDPSRLLSPSSLSTLKIASLLNPQGGGNDTGSSRPLSELSSPSRQEDDSFGRRFKCGICGKRYMTAAHLARHETMHTGEKPFVCPFPGCGSRFSRNDNCMQHYKTHNNPRGKTTRRMYRKTSKDSDDKT